MDRILRDCGVALAAVVELMESEMDSRKDNQDFMRAYKMAVEAHVFYRLRAGKDFKDEES